VTDRMIDGERGVKWNWWTAVCTQWRSEGEDQVFDFSKNQWRGVERRKHREGEGGELSRPLSQIFFHFKIIHSSTFSQRLDHIGHKPYRPLIGLAQYIHETQKSLWPA